MDRIIRYLKHLFWRHRWNFEIKSGKGNWDEINACWERSEFYRTPTGEENE